jgi:hypothetical protein
MTTVKDAIPATTARASLQAAGDALVEQKIVSRKQMDRIFGNTTLSHDERRVARKLIRHAHDAVNRDGLGRAAKNAVAEFENAVAVETNDKQRIEDARIAKQHGAIDDKTYAALTSGKPGLRAKLSLWASAKAVDDESPAKAAVDRLAQGTSSTLLRVAKNEKTWGLAAWAGVILSAVLVPHVTAGLLLAQSFASVLTAGVVTTALRDVPDTSR